jgi:hypothetical protein
MLADAGDAGGSRNQSGNHTYLLATILDYDVARALIAYNGRRRIVHMFSSAYERGGTMIVCISERGGCIPHAVYRVRDCAKANADFANLMAAAKHP